MARIAMLLTALVLIAAPAQAQESSTSGGDEFNSNSPDSQEDGPGGGPMYGDGQYGSDPQCGGTDRAYYDKQYNSKAIVLDPGVAQQLYGATHGQIWIRCGACVEDVICWPRDGYEDLIAEAPHTQRPGQPDQPSSGSKSSGGQSSQTAKPKSTGADVKSAIDNLQWKPLKAGVLYAATPFRGGTLHAVKITGKIKIGFKQTGARTGKLVDAAGNDIIGGVTGTFSNWGTETESGTKPLRTAGPVVQGGKMIWPRPGQLDGIRPDVPRTFLGQHPDGTFFIAEVDAGPELRKLPAKDLVGAFAKQLPGQVAALGAEQGVGGLGLILDGGKDVHKSAALGKQRVPDDIAGDGRNARAVAGIADNGGTLILLVEERDDRMKTGTTGATTGNMVDLLRGLGAQQGVIMDGGGSAQIYIRGKVDSRPAGRRLPTAIMF